MPCGSCRFALLPPPDATPPTSEQVQCRREPPKIVQRPGRLAGQIDMLTMWPPVHVAGWCGEYLPRIPDSPYGSGS